MVRILACVKQARDVSQLKVEKATRHVTTIDASKKISDFDKNVLEEELRLKGKLRGKS
jgi:electron transfer flavoprotein alpha/beta subunit